MGLHSVGFGLPYSVLYTYSIYACVHVIFCSPLQVIDLERKENGATKPRKLPGKDLVPGVRLPRKLAPIGNADGVTPHTLDQVVFPSKSLVLA